MNKGRLLLYLLIFLVIYYGLKMYGGIWGYRVVFGISQLVTFLHEFGHALGALISGGSVKALQINATGGGYTVTQGGSSSLILMGGYIGSAVLGNLLLFIGAKFNRVSAYALVILGFAMIFSGLIWFNSFYTTGVLIFFGLIFCLIGAKGWLNQEILIFLGLVTILYILEDFRVGPSSDLEKYAQTIGVFSKSVWMYTWLLLAVVLSLFNLYMIFNARKRESRDNLNEGI